MASKKWVRPKLPIGHDGITRNIGIIFICTALTVPIYVFASWDELTEADRNFALWQIGLPIFCLGFVMSAIGSLIKEIRLMAYEAALRAGEVEAVDD